MGNRKITKKAIKGKEGIHPGSRKAAQLTRVHLRVDKLKQETKARKDQASSKLQRPLFFIISLSSPNPISLDSLKALITEVYLTRHDPRIDQLMAERRPGRPKQAELLNLEEVRRRETHEYQTGMEVPDLTHAPTTHLMWSWLESDTAIAHSHLELLRHVRVGPDMEMLVTKKGNAGEMGLSHVVGDESQGDDWTTMAKEKEGEIMQE